MVYIRSLYLGSDEEYDERSFDFSWENKEITEKYAEPLSFFAGTEVLRKSCAIELQNLTPKAMLILESPFIDALDNLTGFKTVTLKLTTFYDEWCPEDAVWYVDGGPSCTDQAAGFWMIVDEMKSTLEQSLGPSVIIEANGEGSILGWELTFHPQDFIVKKNPKANSGSPCSCGLF